MVAGHGGKTLRQTIAHHHTDAYGVDERLYLGAYIGACRREDVRVLQSKLLAHQAQHGLVHHLVMQFQGERHPLTVGQILHVALVAYGQGMTEKLLLHRAGVVHLGLHGDVYLFPESGHAAHTRGVHLAHAVLYLMWIGVDEEVCALAQT